MASDKFDICEIGIMKYFLHPKQAWSFIKIGTGATYLMEAEHISGFYNHMGFNVDI